MSPRDRVSILPLPGTLSLDQKGSCCYLMVCTGFFPRGKELRGLSWKTEAKPRSVTLMSWEEILPTFSSCKENPARGSRNLLTWAWNHLASISGTAITLDNLLHLLVSVLSFSANQDTVAIALQFDKLSVAVIRSCDWWWCFCGEQTSKIVSWTTAYVGALFHAIILLVGDSDPDPTSWAGELG